MSKDFEKSYRELAKSEAPDLWDRIESGLSRQSTRGQAEEEKRTETAPKEILWHRSHFSRFRFGYLFHFRF